MADHGKADKALLAKLASAGPDEELTVILEIGEPKAVAGDQIESLSLDEVERAKAVHDLEKASMEAIQSVLDSLADLGLKPRGGRYAPVVVVKGPAAAVREALTLDAVSSATLDESLDLIAPERSEGRE